LSCSTQPTENPPAAASWRGTATSSTLNEVLSQSDFVSMHAPARPEVHHMLTEKHFRQMKKSASSSTPAARHCGRGIADQALQGGLDRACALDVLEKEPASHNNPMLSMETSP